MRREERRASALSVVFPQAEIRRAIADDELVAHYQPIDDLATGEVRGVEALVRWQRPTGQLIAPDVFLPSVVDSTVICDLTRWMLRTACTAAAQWVGWTVSVNITAADVADRGLVDVVRGALEAAGLGAEHLVLELTETALVQDLPRAAGTLALVRDLGVRVDLDDFGTGYSSLLHLRDLPVTGIKIDRSFVSGITGAPGDSALVAGMVALARNVGLSTIAEGVESAEEARVLRRHGCDAAQGYLWSRPVPQVDLDAIHRDGIDIDALLRPSSTDALLVAQVRDMVARGSSLRTVAAALNAMDLRTDRGARWTPSTVTRLLDGVDPTPL
jgi:EAL domain-containing protein (putative c-di-GMP-specific phosphodiesterase class I)